MKLRREVEPGDGIRRGHETRRANKPLLEEGQALAALSHSALGGLERSLLLRMYRWGRSQRYQPGERIWERSPGRWVVLDGQVELRAPKAGVLATLGRSSICGEEWLTGGSEPVELVAGGPDGAWMLFLEEHAVRAVLPLTPRQRGAVGRHLHLPSVEPPGKSTLLQLRSHEPLNLDALTELLARTIVSDFQDRVVIVRKGRRAACSPIRPGRSLLFQASIVDGTLPFSPDAFDFIFADEETFKLLEHHPALQHATIQLTRELSSAKPAPEEDILTLLMPVSPSPVDGELEGVVDPGQMPRIQQGCWIHLPDNVLSGECTEPEWLDERTRQHLSRWARAVTHRRVGLALSGGGAWGFYHYVILEELARKKVPIDIITGSSVGSAMGAYYSVLGLDGLERFRARCAHRELSLIAWLSVLSTAPVELLVRRDLGDVQFDQLSSRVHPVAMNLSTSEATAFTRGSLSLAVRASSSAPGLWGPTLLKPRHFVDGAAVDNLPALWLPHLGADLTFSSNCYPAQLRPYRQLIPGRVGRLLKELNPLERLLDLVSSGSSLLHASGDLGARMSTRAFHKKPVEESLVHATNFNRADEIIDEARNDEALSDCLGQFVKDWERLCAPRRQVHLLEPQLAIH